MRKAIKLIAFSLIMIFCLSLTAKAEDVPGVEYKRMGDYFYVTFGYQVTSGKIYGSAAFSWEYDTTKLEYVGKEAEDFDGIEIGAAGANSTERIVLDREITNSTTSGNLKLITLKFKRKAAFTEGQTATVTIKNIKIADANEEYSYAQPCTETLAINYTVLGDWDDNGVVNIKDAIHMLRYASNKTPETTEFATFSAARKAKLNVVGGESSPYDIKDAIGILKLAK